MAKRDATYLGHMLDAARKITGKISASERGGFDSDENLRLAITHLLQIIGEAASRVEREDRQNYPQIRWADVIGMRQRLVHDYLNVDDDIVWATATEDIPPLEAALAAILGE